MSLHCDKDELRETENSQRYRDVACCEYVRVRDILTILFTNIVITEGLQNVKEISTI